MHCAMLLIRLMVVWDIRILVFLKGVIFRKSNFFTPNPVDLSLSVLKFCLISIEYIGKLDIEMSDFEHPVLVSENFLSLAFFAYLCRITRASNHINMKEIARHPQATPKKIHISTIDPLFPNV